MKIAQIESNHRNCILEEAMSGRTLVAGFAVLALTTGLAAAQQAKLSDPQIAHIAYTADEIDIKAAQQALQKSHNREVREFAQDMVRDHTAVNDKALAGVKKLNVAPQDNDTNPGPFQQADAAPEKPARLRCEAVDLAYAP